MLFFLSLFFLCYLHLLSLCLNIWKTGYRLHHQEVVLTLPTFGVRVAYLCFANNGNSRFQVAQREDEFGKERENKKLFCRGESYWNQCSGCNEIRCGRSSYRPVLESWAVTVFWYPFNTDEHAHKYMHIAQAYFCTSLCLNGPFLCFTN